MQQYDNYISSAKLDQAEDYWSVGNKPHFSWILRKLIKLREEASALFLASVNWAQVKGGWIWDRIRERKDKVIWHRLIWFPAHVPKYSLITWMAILDRLSTKDRLARFGVMTDLGCRLCGAGLESRNHLFLECSYSKAVWDSILHACRLQQQDSSWDDLLGWMACNWKGKSLLVHILKLAWTGFVYFTWEERNYRIFRGLSRSPDTIVDIIKGAVRTKLYRHDMNRVDNVNRQLCIDWELM
ncbi:uncharacterized protein LOC120149160 [Hibiscus syriacus]|uniref:uncharacterized protein LOC120149160 n=1 Tax=Hibiscus syriacus TaxID=106335 RepID=UPI0019231B79|nr:uncharacterized protein LOC120149160 [Hibiscus syriacus]